MRGVPRNWGEWVENSPRVLKVILFDGTRLLMTFHHVESDGVPDGQLVVRRMFIKRAAAAREPGSILESDSYFYQTRCFAKGSWVEWEDVSDRITSTEMEEMFHEDPAAGVRGRPKADPGVRVPAGGADSVSPASCTDESG